MALQQHFTPESLLTFDGGARIGSFIKFLRYEKRSSENTIVSYEKDLQQFESWLVLRGSTLPCAQRQDVRDFLADRIAHGLSAQSARRKLSALRSFYRFLLNEDWIHLNPANGIPMPKTWKKLPHFLTADEVESMVNWHAARQDKLSLRDKAILLTLFASGLRESELVNLKLADVDLDGGFLRVWKGKNGKDGIAPLSRPAIEALKIYIETARPKFKVESPFLFLPARSGNKKMTRQTLFYRVRDIARSAIGRDVGIHEFRHGCATALVKGGADIRDVQAVLRHSEIDTTQIYVHADITYLRGIYDKFHPRA